MEEFLGDYAVEPALGAFNELYSKYKYMESSFERSKNVYKSKIPEIEQTLELIKAMKQKQEDGEDMITNYSLCDTLYSKAQVTSFLDINIYLFFVTILFFAMTGGCVKRQSESVDRSQHDD